MVMLVRSASVTSIRQRRRFSTSTVSMTSRSAGSPLVFFTWRVSTSRRCSRRRAACRRAGHETAPRGRRRRRRSRRLRHAAPRSAPRCRSWPRSAVSPRSGSATHSRQPMTSGALGPWLFGRDILSPCRFRRHQSTRTLAPIGRPSSPEFPWPARALRNFPAARLTWRPAWSEKHPARLGEQQHVAAFDHHHADRAAVAGAGVDVRPGCRSGSRP